MVTPASSAEAPVRDFRHFGLSRPVLRVIERMGYERPTPVQSQAVPIAMAGHDIIGVAQTGSGKTAAFVWPMIEHVLSQHILDKGQGPIGTFRCVIPT